MLSGLDIESVYLCDDTKKHKNLALICSDNLPLLLHHWHRLIKTPDNAPQDNPGIDIEHLLSLLNIKKLSFFNNEAQKNVIALPDAKDLTPDYQFYRNFDMSIVHHRLEESSLNDIVKRSMLSHNITKPNGFIIHQIALHQKINHREYFDLMRHIAINCGYIWRFAVCNTIDGDQRNLDLMNNFAHLFSDFNQDDFAHLLQEFRNSSLHIKEAQLYLMFGFQRLNHREWQWQNTRTEHHYVRSPCSEAISMRDNVPEAHQPQIFPQSHFLQSLDKYHYYPFAHRILPYPFAENVALQLLRLSENGDMNDIKAIFNREISRLFADDTVKKLLLHSANAFKSYYGYDIFNDDIDNFCQGLFFRIKMDNHPSKHQQIINGNQSDELITILFYVSHISNACIDYYSPLGGAIAYNQQGIIDDTSLMRSAKSQILAHNHAHIHLSAWNSVWRIGIDKNQQDDDNNNYLLFRVDIAHKNIRNMGHFKKFTKKQ